MKEAGVNGPLTLKFLYRNDSEGSRQDLPDDPAGPQKVGIKVKGVPATNADFYTKYLQEPETAQRGCLGRLARRMGF